MLVRHLLAAVAGLVVFFLPTFPIAQQPNSAVPDSLLREIGKLTPGAVIVGAEEVDAIACHPLEKSPGLVRADLNGDGRDDYAVLLKTRETGKETLWEGKKLREARFAFALFIDDGKGSYKPRIVRRFTDFVPVAVVLDLQPAGSVRHRETRKNIHAPNAAVTLSFCEKSATTYYMDGGKLRSIPIAD
jgi:hypothetical protein